MSRDAPPPCHYCGCQAILVDSAMVYSGRSFGMMWVCGRWPICDASVGCHPGTTNALGLLANKETRKARTLAHAAFDPLWRSGRMSRGQAYAFLGRALGKAEVHIGESDPQVCARIIELSRQKFKEWESNQGGRIAEERKGSPGAAAG